MSKSLIFSDLHLHPFNYGSSVTEEGLNSRLAMQAAAAEEMINDAVNEGVTHAYFTGDLFHVHGQIPTQALMVACDIFTKIRNQGISIRAIPGNHDQFNRQGTVHGLQFLPESERIGHWVDEDQSVYSLPYTSTDDVLEKFLGDIGDGDGSMILLHQGVAHVPLSSGYVLDERLTPEMIPDNCKAFTGHYHFFRQVSSNLTVVGNLTPLTWGDIDQNKGWLIYDRESGELEQKIQTKSPNFISWSPGIVKHSDLENVVGNFVRYTQAVHYSEQADIRASLIKDGALAVEFPTQKVERKQDDNIRTGDEVTIDHIVEQFDKRDSGRRQEVGREIRESKYETPEWRNGI